MKKLIPILVMALLLVIPIASATHATSTVLHGQVLDISGVPEADATLRVTISTSNSCDSGLVYNTTFYNATNGDGVYNLDIDVSLNYNQLYYTCVFVNDEQMGSPQPSRIGQGQIDEGDVYFTDLTIHNDFEVNGDSQLSTLTLDDFLDVYGDANFTSTVAINEIISDLIPTYNNTFNIGSLSDMWKNLFLAGNLYVDQNATIDGELFVNKDADFNANVEVDNLLTAEDIIVGTSITDYGFFNISGEILMKDNEWLWLDTAMADSGLRFNTGGYTELFGTDEVYINAGGVDYSFNGVRFNALSNGTIDIGYVDDYFKDLYITDIYLDGNIYGNVSGTSYWNQTSGVLIPLNTTDSVGVAQDEFIYFDYPTGNVYIYHDSASGITEFASMTAGNDIYITADNNISFEAGENVVIEGTALDLNSYAMYGAGSNTQKIQYDVSNGWWNITPNIFINDDDNIIFGSYGNITPDTTNGAIEINTQQLNILSGGTGTIYSDGTFINGDANNYTQIAPNGEITLYGDARKYKSIWNFAYNVYGRASTYNGIVCTASSLSILDNQFLVQAYADGSGANVCDATVMTFRMPTDYESGEDVIVSFDWSASATTGDVAYGVGLRPVNQGASYTTSTYTWQTGTATASSTSYGMVQTNVTFASPSLNPGDDVGIVFYRYGDDVGDTLTGNALVSTIALKYVSNSWGEDL